MALKAVKSRSNSGFNVEYFPLAAVLTAKNEVVYDNGSGYVTNATASSARTSTMFGVTAEIVDNSGGSSGDKQVAVYWDPNIVYEADCNGTMDQTDVGTSCPMSTSLLINESSPQTDNTGVVKIWKKISASKALVSINYNTP